MRREFQGTRRFSVRRRLGSGGMGVVYHAYDRERGFDVALKTLRRLDAKAIYRLKKEFRALANVSHPNLVTLYELVSEGDSWFYTMELVRGLPFIEYVRSPEFVSNTISFDASTITGGPIPSGGMEDETTTQADTSQFSVSTERSTELLFEAGRLFRAQSQLNAERLRPALIQLAKGLGALHAAGKLHRDLKPSNILVSPAGRVVILDFGLVAELNPSFTDSSSEEGGIAGTFLYMAPEQGGKGLQPACDWYSVGVLLYEALTGRPPYEGSGIEVLLAKQRDRPTPPSEIAPSTPRDLEALTMALLRIDPNDRPKLPEILRRLGDRAPLRPLSSITAGSSFSSRGPFVGRHPQLAALESAFSAVRSNQRLVVAIRGQSGIGKSSVAARFLDDLRKRDEAVVLTGRCHERESMPYKALDSIMDALARYLSRTPNHEVLDLIPRDVRSLVRLFPALDRVEIISAAPRLTRSETDPIRERQRAFVALKELLVRVSERAPIVMFIDDLQWGDMESLHLLLELLRPPDAPRMLLLTCHRSEEEVTSPVVRELLRSRISDNDPVRTLSVGCLTLAEARDLALTLLGGRAEPESLARAESIARESGGNPFFVDAIVRYAKDASVRVPKLDEVLGHRIDKLSGQAKTVLDLVAIAGSPLPLEGVRLAAGLPPKEFAGALDELRRYHLVRAGGAEEGNLLEPYHDRIREAVVTRIEELEATSLHLRLAESLEGVEGADDPRTLYEHYRLGGDKERAKEMAAKAGADAMRQLAFARAAEMFRRALDLGPHDQAMQNALLMSLGDALSYAGEGGEAARAFLQAAKSVPAPLAEQLRTRAAGQYLMSGHIDQGLALLEGILRDNGIPLASSPARAYTSRELRNAQLWLRGLGFEERSAERADPTLLKKVDLLWAASTGLGLVDFARAADCQGRHLLLALKAGEPSRAVRAFALEAWYTASEGARSRKKTESLVDACQSLARRLGHPHAIGLANLSRGFAHHLMGEWGDARAQLESAEAVFRDHCQGAFWEIGVARFLLQGTLFYLGALPELAQRVAMVLDEAEARGDLFEATTHRIGHANATWLVQDNPERATRFVDEAMGRWSHRAYYVQHFFALLARGNIALYAGRAREALDLVEADWPAIKESLMMKVPYLSTEARYLRARAAIASACQSSVGEEDLLSIAERDAKRISQDDGPWAAPLVEIIRGGIALVQGDRKQAVAAFSRASVGCRENEMPLIEAALQFRLSELVTGTEADTLLTSARRWMASREVKNPRAITRLLVPCDRSGVHS